MFRHFQRGCRLTTTGRQGRSTGSTQVISGTRHRVDAASPLQSVDQDLASKGSIEESIRQLLKVTPPSIINGAEISSYGEYQANGGRILDHILPYEAYPSLDRRASSRADDVVLVVHVADVESPSNSRPKHVLSSGFVIEASTPDLVGKDKMVVSCAHTLEQVSNPSTHPEL